MAMVNPLKNTSVEKLVGDSSMFGSFKVAPPTATQYTVNIPVSAIPYAEFQVRAVKY